MQKKISFAVFLLVFLVSCASPATPQPTATRTAAGTQTKRPESTTTETSIPGSTETPEPTLTATVTQPVTYSSEQLNAMSDEQKIAAAPPSDKIELPAWGGEGEVSQEVIGGKVVVYRVGGRQYGAYDLTRGKLYDGVSTRKMADGSLLYVFFDNDESLKGTGVKPLYIPGEKGEEDDLATMMRGIFGTNWAVRNGEIDKALLRTNHYAHLSGKRELYNKIMKEFDQQMRDGTLFTEGKIPLDGGKIIEGQLPIVEIVYEYSAEDFTIDVIGRSVLDTNTYRWVTTEYDKGGDILTVRIAVNEESQGLMQQDLVGGPVLGSLRSLVDNRAEAMGGGSEDFSGLPLLDAFGVEALGTKTVSSTRFNSERNLNWFVPQGFDGLPEWVYEGGAEE